MPNTVKPTLKFIKKEIMSEENIVEEGYVGPDTLIIDADSMLYRICWKQKSHALARDAMDDYIMNVVNATNAANTYVFVKGKNNFRHNIAIDYKATRVNALEPEMKERIDKLYEYCHEMYVPSDMAEADDYCSIYHNQAIEGGHTSVVAHVDKDLNMIPGMHYNYVKKQHYFVSASEAHTFLMAQLMTGDAADNIQGLRGIGPQKSKKYLEGLSNEDMLEKVLEVWQKEQGDVWKGNFVKCANLIYIRPREELLRELSFEELCEEFKWEGPGPTFYPISSSLNVLDSDVTGYCEHE